MTHGARSQDEIYETIRDRLTGKIKTLTNFTTNSFNYVWTQAFAEQFREQELKLTVAQFAGWVDYAGGPIDEDDLVEVGIDDDVDPSELEEFLDDQHLDELVKLVGVTRGPGSTASGDVTFTTQLSQTTIPSGTSVGTQPDSTGNFFRYQTTKEVTTANGVTTVSAPIEAVEIGEDYNTTPGTVTYLPSPPGGVVGVTNNNDIDGGDNEETNDELRERAKNAIFANSGGGTVQGMIGYIESNTGATEVDIVEFPSGDSIRPYPHGHVIVVGGTEAEVTQAIEESRPAAVEHLLRRPNTVSLSVDITLDGDNINTSHVEDRVEEYLDNLELGEAMYEDRLIFVTVGSDSDDIINIVSLNYSVLEDSFDFDSSQLVYDMQLGEEMLDNGVSKVSGTLKGSSYDFVEGSDWEQFDNDSDSEDDAIDWTIGKSSTTDTISYVNGQTEYDLNADMIHESISSVQNTTQSTTLTEDVDWEEADTTGNNLHNGIRFLNQPNNGDDIDVTYEFGDLPDVLVNQTIDHTYDSNTAKYSVDGSLVDGGITEVTGTLNGVSNTFVEGADYEEWDSDGDGRPEGIEWLSGGDDPDDDTTFTVTYDAGSTFLVDYDIEEADIIIDRDEKIDAGNISASVV